MGLVIKLSMGSRASRDNPMVFMTQPKWAFSLESKTAGSWTTELSRSQVYGLRSTWTCQAVQNVELGDDKQSNHSASRFTQNSDSWEPGGLVAFM